MVYEIVSGKSKTFPWKLHEMLQMAGKEGFDEIVSWLPDEKSFKVHKPDAFVDVVMPKFFQQSKYKSFQRQLNLWGFERLTTGWGKGGYTRSNYFLRHNSLEIVHIKRRKMHYRRVSRKKKADTIKMVIDDNEYSNGTRKQTKESSSAVSIVCNDCSDISTTSRDSGCEQPFVDDLMALTTPLLEKDLPTGLISDTLPEGDKYPQTGDCLDFEGRSYFFVDEEEIEASTRITSSNIGLLQRRPTPQFLTETPFSPYINTFENTSLQQVF